MLPALLDGAQNVAFIFCQQAARPPTSWPHPHTVPGTHNSQAKPAVDKKGGGALLALPLLEHHVHLVHRHTMYAALRIQLHCTRGNASPTHNRPAVEQTQLPELRRPY